jgi:hypothetical protein
MEQRHRLAMLRHRTSAAVSLPELWRGMMPVERLNYHLTPEEEQTFRALPTWGRHDAKQTWVFWQDVCAARILDHKTVMVVAMPVFSALPAKHRKHWCWPLPLYCKKATWFKPIEETEQ